MMKHWGLCLALCASGFSVAGCVQNTVTSLSASGSGVSNGSAATHRVVDIPQWNRYRLVDKIVTKNTDTMLNYWQAVATDCSAEKFQVLRIAKDPQHGTATLVDYSVNPSFPAGNPRSRCNVAPVSATSLHYKPATDFTGVDAVPVTVAGPRGTIMNALFRIRVVD
ncbi:hypothetical protein AA23498_0393 [Acetobacter nitrogenifigens DSM 23921 = NBRC 105050]|uniref:Lipoprotein n=1 Tax=Acetobacter nitrogenifigens DSM 23921 = NBRC 105050 TaxID=1120919 RepID=A0A511XBY1_9PROT|nr:hypothetical protein [Acetobacter nitrogenifigens]GBQ88504.1 hypothetical protein AA23498_0393 [Acetobacter nitrogenifigens DSM 23921 = NBRC 105050]GEN60422.1 hypothetical protein ANI02nite_23060 [Acetobacter nitrogenifigens DSM 23921 = NBRC 105050]